MSPTLPETGVEVDPPPPDWLAVYARSFLYMFVDGTTENIRQDLEPSIEYGDPIDAFHQATPSDSCFGEWLTHNAGANFNEDGIAEIRHRFWRWDSRVARFFAQRAPFAPTATVTDEVATGPGGPVVVTTVLQTASGAELERFYELVVRPEAEAALAGEPPGSVAELPLHGDYYRFPNDHSSLFKSQSPSWVPAATVDVGDAGSQGGWAALLSQIIGGTESFEEYEASGTIGRGRVLDPRFRFVVMKMGEKSFHVERVHFECTLKDLYDFNYESGDLPSHAAAVQIGHQRNAHGQDEGQIYFDEIEINVDCPAPFDYDDVAP